jgi:glycosyltransferase involved in cell wall biosynthesis
MIAVSEFIRQILVRQFQVSPQRVKTIHNGVDPARFAGVLPEEASQFRHRHGARPEEVVVSLVGRISRAKGHYDLVNALEQLPKRLNYRCFVVGEGKQRKPLEKLVRVHGLGDKVTFCGYQANIPVVMAASDIVLLPSHREPFGLTIVEAMLSRRTVLASNLGGIPEIVTDNEDGVLFESRNAADLAKSIERLVSDRELRLRLAEQGYKTAVDRFLLSKMIDETEKYYSEIVASQKCGDVALAREAGRKGAG